MTDVFVNGRHVIADGACTTIDVPALYEEAGRILSGEAEGKDTERFGNRITVYNTGTALFLCARKEKDVEA